MGRYRPVLFADCQGIAHDSDFMNMMQRILKMLESEYGRPVDIEFAMEEGGDGKIHLNLFQCRPLRQVTEQKFVMPEGNEEEVLFDVRRTSMWRSKEEKLDIIVWVDPQKYYEYPYAKKPDVAHMIGVINQYFSQQGRHMMLLVPGLAITNAVRDSIGGDLLAGIIRAIEACLIAVAIALGAGVTMSIWLTLMGGA